MMLAPNVFSYEAKVCSDGYEWLTREQVEARLKGAHLGRELHGDGPFLVRVDQTGKPKRERDVIRHPTNNPGLFREFASLDGVDKMRLFANEHGPSGLKGDVVRIIEHHSLSRTRSLICEYYTHWAAGVAFLRVATDLLDAIRDEDRNRRQEQLQRLLHWELKVEKHFGIWCLDTHPQASDSYDLDPDDPSADFSNDVDFDSTDFFSVWVNPDFEPVFNPAANRVRLEIRDGPLLDKLIHATTPLEEIALAFLVHMINLNLTKVHPLLVIGLDNHVSEKLRANTLYSAMWSQVFTSLTETKDQRKCPACEKWFEIDRKDGRTDRRVYCSTSCRVRDSQRRKEAINRRVEQLVGDDLTPKQILLQLKEEGHETDLPTVKKWIKNSNKRN